MHGSHIDELSAEPNDHHAGDVHDQHHRGHHEGHGAIGEELRFEKLAVGPLETRLLIGLAIEGAHHGKPRELFARNQVDLVDELLHNAELRHGNAHEQTDDRHHRNNRKHDDPPKRQRALHHHDDAADRHDGRVEHHTLKDDRNHLNQLYVVGAARDQRCRTEGIDFLVGKAHHLREEILAQTTADLGSRPRGNESDHDARQHGKGGHTEHQGARLQQISHLQETEVAASALVLGTSSLDSLLLGQGVARRNKGLKGFEGRFIGSILRKRFEAR